VLIAGSVETDWLVKLVQKYGSSVVIKSKGVDDECVVRKQEIAVV